MQNPCAAILIIGNEILSGRTLDTNTQTIAKTLEKIGVVIKEARTVPDEKQVIIASVLALSQNMIMFLLPAVSVQRMMTLPALLYLKPLMFLTFAAKLFISF